MMSPNLDLPGKEAYRLSQVDLSPFATVVAFDPVLPLARVPVPAGEGDDPSKGPYVLAFRNEETWRQAWRTCKDKISAQCEAGAKVGCSISAAKACGRRWWKPYFPFLGPEEDDQSRREECEQREMMGCLVISQERCSRYARETCDPVFANVRIAVPGAPVAWRFSGKPLRRPRVTRHDKIVPERSQKSTSIQQEESPELLNGTSSRVDSLQETPRLGVTTFRGRLLMQNDRRDEWDRVSLLNSHGARGDGSLLHQPFPKEGWVGGLVHPAPTMSHDVEKVNGDSDHTRYGTSAGKWWQRFHQSLMEKFTFRFL